MRASILSALAMATLFACESSVDICGGGAVCGADGVTYADACASSAAGTTIVHTGACEGECPVCADFECYGESVYDERGCATCTCACDDGDCPRDQTCVEGTCVPKDGGLPDGAPIDAGRVDAERPDGGGCVVDSECVPGTCEGGMCVYPCDGLGLDCNDDGSCESMLGSLATCTGCDDDCRIDIPPRSTATCVAGEGCQYPCVDGFDRCDGSDGCDTDLSTNRQNCGRCANTCGPLQVCADGTCVNCPNGRCGNECVDTASDPRHCGSCGIACGSDETCLNASCVPNHCFDPEDPAWTCSNGGAGCTCSCDGRLTINVTPGGLVSCPVGLPGVECLVMGAVECAAYDTGAIAGCCLD